MTYNEIKSKLLDISGNAIMMLLTIIFSMSGFWLMIGREFTTRSEVDNMISTKLNLTAQKLEGQIEEYKILRSTIDRNTDAVIDLKVQLAALSQAVKFMSEKDKK